MQGDCSLELRSVEAEAARPMFDVREGRPGISEARMANEGKQAVAQHRALRSPTHPTFSSNHADGRLGATTQQRKPQSSITAVAHSSWATLNWVRRHSVGGERGGRALRG